MLALKITTVGSSAGVVLPKEALTRLKVKKGDRLFLLETPPVMNWLLTTPSFKSRWKPPKRECGAIAMRFASLRSSDKAQAAGLARSRGINRRPHDADSGTRRSRGNTRSRPVGIGARASG